MSDFAQAGLICTLQRLNESHAEKIEAGLSGHTSERPITLVLPCRADDLQQPALERIIAEIGDAPFLREILVSTNGLKAAGLAKARRLFRAGSVPVRVLRADSPRTQKALARSKLMSKTAAGKGFNVWLATGVVIAEGESKIIATQDCDVLSFRRENLTRLAFAAVHPELRYRFCKMYYSRATDRLYGRVSRLFLAPLLQALVRATGHQPLLDFLQSFRYPLAGECALEVELARELPLASGWGLELGMMCEVFRRAEPQRVAQVDGGSDYDHRHQPLGDGAGGLFRMSKEVAHALLSQLVEEGLPVCAQFLDALAASFARESAEALRRSRHLTLINGLGANEDDAAAVALFQRALAETATEVLGAHMPSELPPWSRVAAANPRIIDELLECVALDNP